MTIDVPVPIGLVFESDNTGIIVNGASLETRQNLALIGAGIRSSGQISAPGQDITLATVPAGINSVVRLEGTGEYLGQRQGSGQPNLENRDILLTGGPINAGSAGTSGNIILDSAGDILLSKEAVVDVRGGSGGNITVNAQNLEINRSKILAGIASNLGSPKVQAGNLNINVAETVRLQGGDSQFFTSIGNQVNAGGLGNAGNININTRTLEGSGAFQISSSTFAQGNAGRVNIKAKDAVSLNGVEDFLSGIFSSVQSSAIGEVGGIDIEAGSISVSNGAVLFTSTLGQGNAGNINIQATESVSLSGGAYLEANTSGIGNAGNITIEAQNGTVSFDGAGTKTSTFVNSSAVGQGGNLKITADTISVFNEAILNTGTQSSGKAGNLSIDTRQLFVRGGAAISTVAGDESEGDGGNLTINAAEFVRLSGDDLSLSTGTLGKGKAGDLKIATRQLLLQDGAQITTLTGGEGDAGSLSVTTGQLLLQDGAAILTSTIGEGEAGSLTVNATESIQIIGTSADGRFNSNLSTTSLGGKGKAGDASVTTRQLLLQDGAAILTFTIGEGEAGSLTVNATESIQLIGTSADGRLNSSLSTFSQGKGKAGDLLLNTRQLLIQDGAIISTRTLGDGKGGILTVNASESIRLSGVRATDSSPTRITSEAQGAGDAGILNISTNNLLVKDGAAITVNSNGTGIGGKLFLEADSLTLDNGTIFAETASTDGGDIILDVQDLLLLRNGSQISTTAGTAGAGGKGGNIFIDAGSIVAIPDENSDITANAFAGDGGQVLINTQSIFGIDFRSRLTPLSDITASSERGAAGVVIINTSGIEPTRGVEALTEERINVEVAQGCQMGGTASGRISFYHVGRGGLPPSPDDLFNSPPTQEWLSLDSEENRSNQPKTEPSFLQQPNNTIASQLIFSCQTR